MAPEFVFESDTLRASLAGRRHPDLIVTFDNWQWRKSRFTKPRAGAHFLKAGFAHLHLSTRANDWFLTPDTPACLDMLRELAEGYRRRAALSFSMGGYGAILLSRDIAFQQMLFFSPQTAFSPDLPPYDDRFHADPSDPDFAALVHETVLAAEPVGGDVVVAFDPSAKMDRAHARAMKLYFKAPRFVELEGAGHPASQYLTQAHRYGTIAHAVTGPDGIREDRFVKAYHEVRDRFDEAPSGA